MDFAFTPEEESFRSEIRTFLNDNLPGDWTDRSLVGDDDADESGTLARKITKGLADKKWLAMAWPEEHGGIDATHIQQMIYNEETTYARMPGGGGMGVAWVGPAIMLYGTDEQKAEYLPKTVSYTHLTLPTKRIV